jgi:hypothetical protein
MSEKWVDCPQSRCQAGKTCDYPGTCIVETRLHEAIDAAIKQRSPQDDSRSKP